VDPQILPKPYQYNFIHRFHPNLNNLTLLFTRLTTILHRFPIFCPLFTPMKWALTNQTGFFGQLMWIVIWHEQIFGIYLN
jgi:hypothetical protein